MSIILYLIIALISFGKGNCAYQETEDSKLVREISAKVIKKLIYEKALFPNGFGARMMHQIKRLHWGFHYYKKLNIPKARRLLIETTEEFLNAFNDDERICPYLANYPFAPKNLDICVMLSKRNDVTINSDELHVVSMREGTLEYDVEYEDTKLLRTVFTETYEEAVEKLKKEEINLTSK